MHKYNTEAIVLRNINYQDSNKIYTLLTKEAGKIAAIGRGVRKISSRRSGNLDTLNYVNLHISEDAKGYKTIQEAKSIKSFKNIKNSLELSSNALYFAELVNIFVNENEENANVFKLFLNSLLLLELQTYLPLHITSMFELKLMFLLGFELTLDKCVACSKIFSEDWGVYGFSYDSGGIYCTDCALRGFTITMEVANELFNISKVSFLSNKSADHLLLSTESGLKAANIIKTHVESVAANYYRRPNGVVLHGLNRR